MPIRAVFLDLDDTLCDTIGCRPQRVRAALSHVCGCLDRHDLDLDALVAAIVDPLECGPFPASVHALARTEARFRTLIEELAPSDPAMLAEAQRIFATEYAALRFLPGVEKTLARLSEDYVLGIISNARPWQESKVRHLGLDRFVRHVTLSDVVGFEKPDPRIFAIALAEAGVACHEAVFVGDRLETDIAGAKAAEMRAIWFDHRGDNRRDDLPSPDAIIERFTDLPSVLPTLQAQPTA